MDKKTQIIILVVAGIFLFLLGGALGVIYSKIGPQAAKVEAGNNLSSGVISSISAFGQVKNISGRNLTLNNLGDDLVIPISDTAQIYAFVTPAAAQNSKTAPVPVQQLVKFEDIKMWDRVNVAVKLLPTGQLQGSAVIILPTQSK